jgi:hypothetical protein
MKKHSYHSTGKWKRYKGKQLNECSINIRIGEANRSADLVVQSLEAHGLTFSHEPGRRPCLISKKVRRTTRIKCRLSHAGDDVVLCLYDRWYGLIDEKTREGRDNPGAEVYICLSADGQTIRLYKGLSLLIQAVLDEWKASDCLLPSFYSKQYPGVKLTSTVDGCDGWPIILMFVPPDSVKHQSFPMIGP